MPIIKEKGLSRHLGEEIFLGRKGELQQRGVLILDPEKGYSVSSEGWVIPINKGDKVGIMVNRPLIGDNYLMYYDRS